MWWLSVLIAVAPQPARFVMEVGGVPAGALSVRVEGKSFVYESTQLFRRGPKKVSVRLAVDAQGKTPAGRVPEVLALLSQPTAGCVDTVEERSGQPSRTCVQLSDDGIVTGTVNAARFTARYSPQGQLTQLEVDGARFVRSEAELRRGPLDSARSERGDGSARGERGDGSARGERTGVSASAEPADVFEAGFPVAGDGPGLLLSPPLDGAREVQVMAVGTPAQVQSDSSCLELARSFKGGAVQVGLVLEGDRAYPHAWVEKAGALLDPSALPGTRRRYLVLPQADAGRVFLELLAGTRRVMRHRGVPPGG